MRAKFWGIIAVAAVSAWIGVSSFCFINRMVDQMEALYIQTVEYAEANQNREAEEKMTEMANVWIGHEHLLEILISHEEIHTVIERIAEAKIYLAQESKDDFFRMMALLREGLEHIKKQEAVDLGNIL